MARFRQLIEVSQEHAIVCDTCDFTIQGTSDDIDKDIKQYINRECPKCGDNLLTKEDYELHIKLRNFVIFVNKWFSWVTVFIKEPDKPQQIEVHYHNGVKFTNIKN